MDLSIRAVRVAGVTVTGVSGTQLAKRNRDRGC
jgi:hypothetical protein